MCGCSHGYTCDRCQPGVLVDLGVPDEREAELERRNRELSAVSFREPFGGEKR